MIEVLDYHTSRTYRKNGKRVKKKSITPEAMQKQNEKQAEAMLRMLIITSLQMIVISHSHTKNSLPHGKMRRKTFRTL